MLVFFATLRHTNDWVEIEVFGKLQKSTKVIIFYKKTSMSLHGKDVSTGSLKPIK